MKKTILFMMCFFAQVILFAQNNYCSDTNLFVADQGFGAPKFYDNVVYGTAKAHTGNNVSLSMDIYLPKAATNTATVKRPLIVWIHGGAFVSGTKEDMTSFATVSAQRGYVSATIGYRLGLPNFNPFLLCNNKYEEFLRAGYRALQDSRTAINFLKKNAAEYGIDTSMIIVGGYSAGALTAINTTYGDKDDFKVYETTLKDLGGLEPVSNIKAAVSIAGTFFDDCIMDANEKIPVFAVHGTCDEVVPYDNNPILFCQNFPKVNGGLGVAQRAQCLGIPYRFMTIQGMGHNIFTPAYVPTMILDTVSNYLKREIICGKTSSGCYQHVIPTASCTKPAVTCPGGCATVISCTTTSAQIIDNQVFDATVFPNPSDGHFTITTSIPAAVEMFDLQGKLIFREKNLQTTHLLNMTTIAKGIFLLRLFDDEKQSVRKIIIE